VLVVTQGDALRACPGLLYIAPLAFPSDVEAKPLFTILGLAPQLYAAPASQVEDTNHTLLLFSKDG